MRKNFSLNDSSVLITGATAGLGAEFARQLAPVSRHLILTGRRQDRLHELATTLQQKHPRIKLTQYCADLSSTAERERLASWIIREEIPLNLLVNNAGLGDLGSFDTATWERLSEMLDVNICALTHLTHRLLPMMKLQSSSGSSVGIINVSSVAGFFPLPGLAVYAATKSYVTSFSEGLRMELSKEGIRVTTLCPGPVPTEFFQVAARPKQSTNAGDRTHPMLASSARLVVSAAIRALERDRPGVIPNRLLAFLVRAVCLLPFPIVRAAIRSGAGPRKPEIATKN